MISDKWGVMEGRGVLGGIIPGWVVLLGFPRELVSWVDHNWQTDVKGQRVETSKGQVQAKAWLWPLRLAMVTAFHETALGKATPYLTGPWRVPPCPPVPGDVCLPYCCVRWCSVRDKQANQGPWLSWSLRIKRCHWFTKSSAIHMDRSVCRQGIKRTQEQSAEASSNSARDDNTPCGRLEACDLLWSRRRTAPWNQLHVPSTPRMPQMMP